MNIEQFTDKAREALRVAAEMATEHHHSQIEVSFIATFTQRFFGR
jgi:hypothetical protein